MQIDALSALALSSLIALGDANSLESWETIQSYELPAVSGLWVSDIAKEGKTCHEYYNFGKDGQLNTVSLTEKTKGTYRFVHTDELPLPMLAMATEEDNNQMDCLGNQKDQTGDSMAFFVKLDSRHNPTKMSWCSDPTGKDCFSHLYRILP